MSGYEFDRDRGFFCDDCLHVAQVTDPGCARIQLNVAIHEPRGCSGCEYLRNGTLFDVAESQRIIRALGLAPSASSPWIPVTEKLPPMIGPFTHESEQCLVRQERDWFFTARYNHDSSTWFDTVNDDCINGITHWAEIRGPK